MSSSQPSYDGALISELGVNRYLIGTNDLAFSNINFFVRQEEAKTLWKECHVAYQGPSYRNLSRPSTKSELLLPLENIPPLFASVADGFHHQSIEKIENLLGGLKCTAEERHLTGRENVQGLWKILRYDLSGANMVYFLIAGVVSEYVARVSLLEKNHELRSLVPLSIG